MKKIDDMTECQLMKRNFVRKHLRGIMKALDSGIYSLQYKVSDDEDEYVIITWKNKCRKSVNVTTDNLFALTRDVIGSLCI